MVECVCVYVCACAIRVPQSAETKGVSLWHLLSPETWHTTRERETKREKALEPTFHLCYADCLPECVCVCVWMLLHLAASAACVNAHTCWQKLWVHCSVSLCLRMNSLRAYICGRRWNVADHRTVPGVCLGHTSKALTHILHCPWGECCKAFERCGVLNAEWKHFKGKGVNYFPFPLISLTWLSFGS